jgi:hypothetical protein
MSFACNHCPKSFATLNALKGHSRIHASSFQSSRQRAGLAAEAAAVARYAESPINCINCLKVFSYGDLRRNRARKFCTSSCAAKYNNVGRVRVPDSRQRTSEGVVSSEAYRHGQAERLARNGWLPKPTIVGPYTKLYTNRCAHCLETFLGRTRRKYCSTHALLYGDEGRNAYEFTFNPFDYPELFSIETLKHLANVGFWSPTNKTGLTRDHKVSVNQAIREGLDPFYIKHPLNCELMDWQTNNQKKTRSSLRYAELEALVNDYERGANPRI